LNEIVVSVKYLLVLDRFVDIYVTSTRLTTRGKMLKEVILHTWIVTPHLSVR